MWSARLSNVPANPKRALESHIKEAFRLQMTPLLTPVATDGTAMAYFKNQDDYVTAIVARTTSIFGVPITVEAAGVGASQQAFRIFIGGDKSQVTSPTGTLSVGCMSVRLAV